MGNFWGRTIGRGVTAAIALSFAGMAAGQQQLPAPLQGGTASQVPTAVQILRWHMLDPDVNALTFRSMRSLFTTRTVPRSGDVWQLPRADHALDFSYDFRGRSYKATEFAERTYTNALIVIKDGRIVSENYRNGTGDQDHFMAWSMTKSLTSLMIGCALAEGRIKSLDDRIETYLPELKGGGYEGVTIRQILQMRSGVDYEERYDFEHPGTAATNHINALVKNVARFADPARTIRRIHTPGAVFQYKTLDTAVLGWLIERVSGGDTIAGYMTKHLWEPLGAEADGFFIMDGPPGVGREFNGAGFNATARDFARVGMMMLNGGNANGHQIVSPRWVAQTTQPTDPAQKPMGYGMQWWTLGDGQYTALGLQGQFIFVDPRTRTVVVKLSYFPPAEQAADEETIAFLKAAAAWVPR